MATASREMNALRAELSRINAQYVKLKLRVAFLEKLITEAPHATNCSIRYRLHEAACNCWKKFFVTP